MVIVDLFFQSGDAKDKKKKDGRTDIRMDGRTDGLGNSGFSLGSRSLASPSLGVLTTYDLSCRTPLERNL